MQIHKKKKYKKKNTKQIERNNRENMWGEERGKIARKTIEIIGERNKKIRNKKKGEPTENKTGKVKGKKIECKNFAISGTSHNT